MRAVNKRIAAVVVAGFVCVVGVVLLFVPVHATDAEAGAFSCGSAAAPDPGVADASTPAGEAEILSRLNSECASSLAAQRAVGFVVLGVGVVGLVVCGLLFVPRRVDAAV